MAEPPADPQKTPSTTVLYPRASVAAHAARPAAPHPPQTTCRVAKVQPVEIRCPSSFGPYPTNVSVNPLNLLLVIPRSSPRSVFHRRQHKKIPHSPAVVTESLVSQLPVVISYTFYVLTNYRHLRPTTGRLIHSPFFIRNSRTTSPTGRCCPSTASFIPRTSAAVNFSANLSIAT